jgi:hypothetical protein
MQFEAECLIFEMRLRDAERTQGLEKFIQELQQSFPDKAQEIKELEHIILASKCPEIRFEFIKALGISKHDACIVNTSVLRSSFKYALYVILHEIAHQMQYSKYGEDFAQTIFVDDLSDQELAQILRKIELTADRYAVAKCKQILKKFDNTVPEVRGHYKGVSDAQLLSHIHNVRRAVQQRNLKNINDINEWIYNSIKIML